MVYLCQLATGDNVKQIYVGAGDPYGAAETALRRLSETFSSLTFVSEADARSPSGRYILVKKAVPLGDSIASTFLVR